MEKITNDLKSSIQKAPDNFYRVLIVIREGSDPNQLPIHNYKQQMSNIISAELKGADILKLAALDQVESVEADKEVRIQ